LLVLLFLGGGLTAFDPSAVTDSFARNVTNLDDVALTSALVFITFFGFEAIATSGGEVRNPRQTVPRAIFVSLGFVTALYVLVVTVVVLAVNDPRFLEFLVARTDVESTAAATQFVANHGEVAMGRAAQYYLGEWGFAVFILGALLSMISAANATILAGSRVKLAMADNEHLPGRFGRIHPRFRVPHNAVLLTGGLILTFILVFTVALGGPAGESAVPWLPHLGLDAMAHFADFMLLGGLAMVNVALIQSRRRYPDRTRLFEVPAVPWVPLVAIASNLLLLVNIELVSLSLGVGAVLVGGIVWLTVID
jgi:APA family basic amino acid/polyamine antiporter